MQFNDFYNIEFDEENIKNICKFIMAHEIGHLLDADLNNNKNKHFKMITSFINYTLKYDINTSNVPYELEEISREIKKPVGWMQLKIDDIKFWYTSKINQVKRSKKQKSASEKSTTKNDLIDDAIIRGMDAAFISSKYSTSKDNVYKRKSILKSNGRI